MDLRDLRDLRAHKPLKNSSVTCTPTQAFPCGHRTAAPPHSL